MAERAALAECEESREMVAVETAGVKAEIVRLAGEAGFVATLLAIAMLSMGKTE